MANISKSVKLGVFTLAIMNVTAVVSLRGLPAEAEYGLSSAFYYLFAAIVFLIPTSLVAAELAAMFQDKQGGVFRWVGEAYGKKWGFLAIFLQWVESTIWYPTVLTFGAVALAFIGTNDAHDMSLASNRYYSLAVVLIIYWLATFISLKGMGWVGKVAKVGGMVGTIIPAGLLMVLAVIYLASGGQSQMNFDGNFFPDFSNFDNLVLASSIFLFYAGMEMGGIHVKDMENPAKNYPKAVFIGAAITVAIFVLGTFALGKELVRSAMLETKEKSRMVADKVGRETGEESPVEYAGNRIERAEQRAGKESASVAYHGGKKLAVKTYEKIKEQRQREAVIATLDSETGSGGTSGQTRTKKGRTGAGRSIKIKPEAEKTVKEAGNRTVKTAPRMVKASPVSSQKVKTQAILQKKQAFQSMRAAREAKRAAMRSVQTAKQSKKTAQATAKGIKAMAEAAAHAVKAAFAALMAGGGTVFVILILIVGIIGGAAFIGSSQSSEPLSAEVLAHTPAIQRYAREFGISEYVPVIQAIMMQESGGRGTDPMQASECPYNTQYPNTPGAIQDADYSIKVGVQYYADCVREAGCESPQDMDKLKLSLQGYNYGNGYISWAIRNHGGYSEANALQFSQEQAAAHGWSGYGDPEYVPHVLRYYSGGGLFAGLFGNGQLVTIAKSQLGNEGGQKFWSWWGFTERQEWCACFVSWCADQAGLIQSGAVPKFSVCTDGKNWFQNQGRWQGAGSMPSPGAIIFFDWEHDGTCDHVGIVERCDGTTVYTIEGNSGDAVKERSYSISSDSIMGYGMVVY